jgi:O-antigen/teichoic acid export membrane protein
MRDPCSADTVISRSEQAREWNGHTLWRRLWGIDFARHALTLGGGNALAQFILLATSPLIARLYSPTAFGLFAIYAALVSVLAVAATAQYEAVLMLPRYHRQAASLLLFLLLFCPVAAVCLGLPFIVFRHGLAEWMGAPRMANWFWAVPVSVALFGWYQALRFWAMRREAFADVARNAVSRAAAGAALACAMGFWPPFPQAPESGLILSQLAGEGLGNLFLVSRILRRDRALLAWPGRQRLIAAARRRRALVLSLTAAQGIAQCYGRLPVLAINWLFGPAAAGLYAWADRFSWLPSQLIAAAVGDVYRQRATVEYHRHGRFDGLMRRTLAATAAIAIVPFALGILLAPTLFGWFFGAEWREAGVLAQVLMVGSFVSFAITPTDKATVIFQRTRYILLWSLSRLLLKLGAVAVTALASLSLVALLWLIVLVRITLYLVELGYNYKLAKGMTGSAASSTTSLRSYPMTTSKPTPP